MQGTKPHGPYGFMVALKRDWPYWVGGLLFAFLNTALVAVTGRPAGITGPLAYYVQVMLQPLGVEANDWVFFREFLALRLPGGLPAPWTGGLLVAGMVAGAALASLMASEFRLRRVKSAGQVATALAGGFLMGYGARVAIGCNVGGMLGGISSLSFHGWLYIPGLLAGAYLGVLILRQQNGEHR